MLGHSPDGPVARTAPSMLPLSLPQRKAWISTSSPAFAEEASSSSSSWYYSSSTSARGEGSTEGRLVSSLCCPPAGTARGNDPLSLVGKSRRRVVSECQGCHRGYRLFHSVVSLICEKQILGGDGVGALSGWVQAGPLDAIAQGRLAWGCVVIR